MDREGSEGMEGEMGNKDESRGQSGGPAAAEKGRGRGGKVCEQSRK